MPFGFSVLWLPSKPTDFTFQEKPASRRDLGKAHLTVAPLPCFPT